MRSTRMPTRRISGAEDVALGGRRRAARQTARAERTRRLGRRERTQLLNQRRAAENDGRYRRVRGLSQNLAHHAVVPLGTTLGGRRVISTSVLVLMSMPVMSMLRMAVCTMLVIMRMGDGTERSPCHSLLAAPYRPVQRLRQQRSRKQGGQQEPRQGFSDRASHQSARGQRT